MIYLDVESLLKKQNNYGNNPEKTYKIKFNKHPVCGFSSITKFARDDPKKTHFNRSQYWLDKSFLIL